MILCNSFIMTKPSRLEMKNEAKGGKPHRSGRWGGKREGAGRKPLGTSPKAKPVSFTLSPDVLERLKEKASATGRSRSQLVEQALEQFLSHSQLQKEKT